ncbi:MAG: HD domain-containing protein [Deltaproteobacteria bacterium]|nr:MAG: HD domain-containing protein [Deltaproteobacteria bacterium]
MKIDSTFLRSKVARRIFLLFVLCALLPIGALAILSFTHVTKQLTEQSQRRLHQAAKAMNYTISERLLFLDAEMRMVASTLANGPVSTTNHGFQELRDRLDQRFRTFVLVEDSGSTTVLLGQKEVPLKLSAAQQEHIRSGRTLLFTESRPHGPARILMQRMFDPQLPTRGILLAEVKPTYLWGTPDESTLPPMTELCVLDPDNQMIFSTLSHPVSFTEQVVSQMTGVKAGQFEWQHEDKTYTASFRSIFLKFRFFSPSWILVLSESKAHVLAPMARFKKIFPLVILLSLWVVLLLSISQIRRSLIPLEKLQEGTRRIAERDFTTQVTVTSGDEFQELATSFNTMAKRLDRQFNTLTTMNEIDRAILSALDTRKIVDTVLTRMRELLPCDCVGVALLDSESPNAGLMHIQYGDAESENWLVPITLAVEEVQNLNDNPEQLLIEATEEYPHYLASLAGMGIELFFALPMFVSERLSGLIAVGYLDPEVYSEEDAVQARQLADQVAVAMSNARLIEELDELNWGTLYALARAIDAKSAWTAGHSERVTQLALRIGQVMGLSQKELDDLHRGGLLHDIGKIGIPPEILDKPGKLTDEEYQFMREHVRIGARILEPIDAYAGVIPIVLQHHEYYDGSGYPDGVDGEDISLGARIFTVSDHYDALISDRPYREGLARDTVIEFIKEGIGSKFDPKVVDAFLEVMAKEDSELQEEVEEAGLHSAP